MMRITDPFPREGRRRRTMVTALSMSAFVAVSGCNLDLDLPNPNAPTEQEVLTNNEGLIALAVGMQAQFANAMHHFVRAPALVTDEWGTQSRALASDNLLVTGEIDRTFGTVSDPYTSTFRIVRTANDLIASVPNSTLGPGFQAGMISLARLYKAMALGMAIQQFEQIPIDADPAGAPLQPRAVVLEEILSQLNQARQALQQPGLDLTGFNQRVLGTGFNLPNTIDAMIARYSLMAGRYQEAIAAAERVSPTVLSTFVYPDPATNPVFNYHFQLNYVGARRSFVEEAEPGDQRPAFWVNPAGAVPTPAFANIPLVPIRRYATRNDPIPVYLPGEMLLIRAEAHARLNQLPQARELINRVRTQCTSPVAEPTACLPALTAEQLPDQAAILRQIAYERRYELFTQGLRWEDMRRFAPVTGNQPSLAWLPIPLRECEANPAVTCPGVG